MRTYAEGHRIVKGHDRRKCDECGRGLVKGMCTVCDAIGADHEVSTELLAGKRVA